MITPKKIQEMTAKLMGKYQGSWYMVRGHVVPDGGGKFEFIFPNRDYVIYLTDKGGIGVEAKSPILDLTTLSELLECGEAVAKAWQRKPWEKRILDDIRQGASHVIPKL